MAAELHYSLIDHLKDIFSHVFFTWVYIRKSENYFLSKFSIFRTEKNLFYQ